MSGTYLVHGSQLYSRNCRIHTLAEDRVSCPYRRRHGLQSRNMSITLVGVFRFRGACSPVASCQYIKPTSKIFIRVDGTCGLDGYRIYLIKSKAKKITALYFLISRYR